MDEGSVLRPQARPFRAALPGVHARTLVPPIRRWRGPPVRRNDLRGTAARRCAPAAGADRVMTSTSVGVLAAVVIERWQLLAAVLAVGSLTGLALARSLPTG